jgi:hypothetical protein
MSVPDYKTLITLFKEHFLTNKTFPSYYRTMVKGLKHVWHHGDMEINKRNKMACYTCKTNDALYICGEC